MENQYDGFLTCRHCKDLLNVFKISLFEFSQNFTVENMENLESVKIIAKSNFKVRLKGNIQSFHHKEILQIFYRSYGEVLNSVALSSHC